ncbi:MAG: transcription termination factor NusA [Thermoflexales bacterium]|nr:transcription termination factor NusA [Thermoflexales bacterium]
MRNELALAINQISSERNLPREIVARVVESALVQAYRKHANVLPGQNVAVKVATDTGEVRVYVEKEVVEEVNEARTEIALQEARAHKPDAQLGDCIMVDVTPEDFGRIAAQNVKQLVVQKLREAERDFQYNQFVEQEGEIVVGLVQSVSGAGLVVDLGRVEGILPRKEQIPGEKYEPQQRLRAYVMEVKRTNRGPQVILSRASKHFLRRLLEIEVPELANGAIEIKAIAREPGSRSKVAVAALQPNVDPVGACIGQRGTRIQNVINELHGEKIDVIEWSADPATYIAKALGPAKVMSVHPHNAKSATVIVPDDQLSLAIGRDGQNARLAARLTNWRIDIRSTSEALTDALNQLEEDEAMRAWVGEEVTQQLPMLRELLVRQRTVSSALSAEEFALVKRVVDAVFAYHMQHKDKTAAAPAKPAQRQAAAPHSEKPRVAVPKEAYAMAVSELGLSPRVLQHLNAAGIVSVGQLLERSARGDEGLLAIEGIGPKALSELKQALDKVVGQWSLAEATARAQPAKPAEETTEQAQQLFIEAMNEAVAVDPLQKHDEQR